jgi:hypothetical protein
MGEESRMIRSIRRLGLACLVALAAALATVAIPQAAQADHANWNYYTYLDVAEDYFYSTSTAEVLWHIGNVSLKPCHWNITSQRADTHSLRVQFLERSTGIILFNQVINSVDPGETVDGNAAMYPEPFSKELYMRYKWGDQATWWEVDYFFNHPADSLSLYPFGTWDPCPSV